MKLKLNRNEKDKWIIKWRINEIITQTTSAFYFSSDIQAQYKVMFGSLPSVEPNDVFFGLHAVLLTLVNIVQIMLYERGGQVVSKICMALCAGGLLSIVVVLILALVSTVKWIWFFYYLSMVKLSITL